MISLETPHRKWASSRLEGRTSWIFTSCSRCSRLTMGTTGTRTGGLRKGQSPCELLGGLSGFLSRQCRGLRPCVESVPEPDVSFPVLTWILGYFPGGFPSRLSHEAFPRGFPTGLSHVPPWSESILGLTVEAVLGKQVSLEWTETSGGLWEWGLILEFFSPFLWRAPPLEMRRER